ncbi:hypothetical protein [Phocaeicola coprocola]|uniref:hypothetical protein n=1 Tax=Phocaeicola coprocola TaxID=310298 RepID=UPI00241D28C9|nr:hypothetical protein [Phocaeicola coprocola]
MNNLCDDELLKSCYNNPETLIQTYSKCDSFRIHREDFSYKLGDCERLKRVNKSLSLKEKRKIIVSQLEQLGNVQQKWSWSLKGTVTS